MGRALRVPAACRHLRRCRSWTRSRLAGVAAPCSCRHAARNATYAITWTGSYGGPALVGTLASELGGHAQELSGQPRVYVDANVPAGLVSYMRATLSWDVMFVLEHPDLRRAPDGEHYRLARQLRRTLITLDRDYLDDRKFPPERSGGVIVLMAPTPGGFMHLLKRLDREVLRPATRGESSTREADNVPWPDHTDDALPLEGRKLHVHVDWDGR